MTLRSGSHPVWVRGLKPHLLKWSVTNLLVAPRVGAWIETLRLSLAASAVKVAPRVGAWIETNKTLCAPNSLTGRTPCGCVD